MNTYDDGVYGVRMRKWFGLGPKGGGEGIPFVPGSVATENLEIAVRYGAGGFYLGTNNPGTISHVEKWFPQGPIQIKKIGVFVCSTLLNASEGKMRFNFLTRGASASVVGTIVMSTATVAEGAFASKVALTTTKCKAGEYLTIQSCESVTTGGTERKATTTGRPAFFVDYLPLYDPARWGG
jgi:hypothetical protein